MFDSDDNNYENIKKAKELIHEQLSKKVQEFRDNGKSDDEITRSFSNLFFKIPLTSKEIEMNFRLGLWSPTHMFDFMNANGIQGRYTFNDETGFTFTDEDGNTMRPWVLRKFGKTRMYYLNKNGKVVPEYMIKSDSDLMRFEIVEDIFAYFMLFNREIQNSLEKYLDDMVESDIE